MTTAPTISVLGLGAMGLPMATHLSGRFPVRGYGTNRERNQLATQAGLGVAPTAVEAARGSDLVLVAVRTHEQVQDLLFGRDGVALALTPGSAVLLTSTVGSEAAQQLDRRLTDLGVHLVDAPISGSPERAGRGDLLVTVGATEQGYAVAHPALEHLASTLVRVGRPGDGQAMKTVNQLLCGVHIAAAAEALALADALGLDHDAVLRALGAGAAASFMLSDRGPLVIEALSGADPEVRSRLDLFVKDLGLVTHTARGAGLPTPVAAAAEGLYLLAQRQGLGSADASTVVRTLVGKEATGGPS